ncbi:MAG: hypothetical protein A2365_03005 [Candidatus Nealsonbacteria bacterium RIFOXYB1_FULL_40_15]|uniref:Uncharacterized protein n=2 Tax=Candidatus Nealsoniibacteriota TaxID=1817911 RepID=A0A1G2EU22_9BACT|nr:MAG: hypothetical protein A2365_03005 [Candidatus Nealsonbacteria bacterium RIFOXYB1_FULL_40_15]OGZ29197.1 MAG: hypothetical protein A2427_02860 [Candidatus Nealsonbacteria bacterium RIFOXYC1_FULL_40_7]OGZ29878.1 MAG: hypothetical protein A2562_02040 [Candidatus Nealsonbacteria bacterium RIFOXYD1_FULL_39_11]
MREINHKGYQIKADAYQDEEGKWVPRAEISPIDGSKNIEESPLVWLSEKFEDRPKAEGFALESAQFYIDTNF